MLKMLNAKLLISAAALIIIATGAQAATLSKRLGVKWRKLHPEVKRRALLVLADAQRAGMRVGIYDGYRDAATQRKYIERGTSGVGDENASYHRWGLAVDFVFKNAAGGWTWEPPGGMRDWYTLGAIIERHGFEWGGRFSNFDGPHAQYPVMRIAQLKRRYTRPEDVAWA